MRRTTALAVGVAATNDLSYELEVSPRSSVFSITSDLKRTPSEADLPLPTTQPAPTPAPSKPIQPSLRLLFSFLSRRHATVLFLPAIASSIIYGGIAPFMTHVIGDVFNQFAQFPLTPNPPQEAKDKLLSGVGLAAIQLVGLAVGSIVMSSLTSTLWIWIGEHNVMALRKHVYEAVTRKDMVWFDTRMGAEGTIQSSEGESGPLGAGGLMAKFTRETDDVRMASSLAAGMLLTYFTTCVTCLALAFSRSWALTLVILSAVPVLMLIQGISQAFAGPLLASERSQTASAATLVDRATSAITTVKAFNAAHYEQFTLGAVLDRVKCSAIKLNATWGMTSSFAQFTMMAMFVQGFWFGAKLIQQGKVSAGDVMSVFWACLIATSNLQMCIPHSVTVAKGKFAVVALLKLTDEPPPSSPAPPAAQPTTPGPVTTSVYSMYSSSTAVLKKGAHRSLNLRKIQPTRCYGELSLHNITFAYPSRPTMPVLENVSLYLPANEMTFIVGASGSGKSTVAQLLMRMYEPQGGVLQLDDQDVRFLDEQWTREHISAVSQGIVLFDKSVHDNVAMGVVSSGSGKKPEDVTRDEVIDACRLALMHEFVRDLPEGYDTMVGTGGAALSGGQKQRLAIARAKLRDPTVLILDEATSALDATSRILVFEAIKRWRANRSTIIITHDLSQITSTDFVYVLKNGRVVEQGYRRDLESTVGEFRNMMVTQLQTGGFLPEKELVEDDNETAEDVVEKMLGEDQVDGQEISDVVLKHQSVARPSLRPLTLGNWMFDVVADLTSKTTAAPEAAATVISPREPYRISRFVPPEAFTGIERQRRPSSLHLEALPSPQAAHTIASKRYSLQFTPTSPVFAFNQLNSTHFAAAEVDAEFEGEKTAMQRTGALAADSRRRVTKPRTRWDDMKVVPLTEVKVETASSVHEVDAATEERQTKGLFATIGAIYPTIPFKPLFFLGLFASICSGAMTPIFSFLLSRLLFEVSTGATNTKIINQYGGIVLGVAALDGILLGLKYFLMETSAITWITRLRKSAFSRVLAQDKKWFDKSENSPPSLVQVLVKDADDARNLVGIVMGQCLVVVTMLGLGLVWALVRGWQLTLVGFCLAPVFGVVLSIQSGKCAKVEATNKRAREDVAKQYYETISNIRGIRCMAFETVFQGHFDAAADRALKTGKQGAFIEGASYGLSCGLVYFAEAMLFYIGAILIARGTYTYLQMVQVLNLVVFTVSIGSQLMAFTQKIAKAVIATNDFLRLLNLSVENDEARGVLKPAIDGPISFHNVQFSYPERPEAPVLKNIDLEIAAGECVAIVGASGSGKSTIASLLQRLYEPTSGVISVNHTDLRSTDIHHLRHNVSVVSQNPVLFDASIAENISYGNKDISQSDIRTAAKAANVHDFIMELPNGYDTQVGENASLISGGQAQRLSIARALARPSKILILDECTSALDSVNQAVVMDTIRHAKNGRTTVMVTHKLQVMQMCDRILVVEEGEIKEHGSYEELMERKGVFASLASGGEWVGE
ncbi:P-loop containing nucleoside triphosphate hydrolase protein [Pluteus cervinus]|uniref:P-loop containing nucleoside triphosphate hydrolase protein n=1 Tax=Pluteus cervinus TaxID=181527 RepID=A0ACD3B036_9AGAR|nr:P-loop containing nucleoside triphosphate hydrolase protein [Pluteus cervinus]